MSFMDDLMVHLTLCFRTTELKINKHMTSLNDGNIKLFFFYKILLVKTYST